MHRLPSLRCRPRIDWYLVCQLALLAIDGVEALPSFLNPVRGPTLQDEIQCYSIPYGGIGFASHVLTYWTLGWIWFGRSPLTLGVLRSHGWNGLLAALSLGGGNALAVFTVIRCRNRWQFILIAVWKICLSSTLALSALTNAIYLPGKEDEHDGSPEPTPSISFAALYVLGLAVGMVGVISLVKETWQDSSRVRLITYVFGGVCGGLAALMMLGGLVACCVGEFDDAGNAFTAVGGIAVGGFVLLGLFYSDWILAAIAGNLAGVPSGDVALLYWLYFAAKRLPMLSY